MCSPLVQNIWFLMFKFELILLDLFIVCIWFIYTTLVIAYTFLLLFYQGVSRAFQISCGARSKLTTTTRDWFHLTIAHHNNEHSKDELIHTHPQRRVLFSRLREKQWNHLVMVRRVVRIAFRCCTYHVWKLRIVVILFTCSLTLNNWRMMVTYIYIYMLMDGVR